jgi:hypothetical protein
MEIRKFPEKLCRELMNCDLAAYQRTYEFPIEEVTLDINYRPRKAAKMAKDNGL